MRGNQPCQAIQRRLIASLTLAMTQKHHCEQTTCEHGNQQARNPKRLLALKPPQIFEERRRGDEQPGGDDEQNPACRGQVWQAVAEHDS